MCGLLAIFRPGGVGLSEAERLLNKLAHRGPDARNVWRSGDGRLTLGHTRLKIIDLSDGANQPMHSPDGRQVLIFNGEIVNYRQAQRSCERDWQFRTNSDTEVLLAGFAQRGFAAMHEWVGMFAFILFDRETNRLYLARDRFGIKPLYWARLPDGGFAAASEIPPLLTLLERSAPDQDTIRTYLETGLYDFGERTFFDGIRSLPAGTAAELELDTGAWRQHRWYCLADRVPDLSGFDESELVEQGAALVEAAIRDHLVADVQVGLNVSGGVDSSVLVGVASKYVENLHVFTQNYPPPYSEADWVRRVAGGAKLHLCELDRRDIESALDATVRRQAEPFGGVTVAGYDHLYGAAHAAGVTVLLDGNGVDEAFLGYTKYLQPVAANGSAAIDGSQPVEPAAIADDLRHNAELLPLPTNTDFAGIRRAAALDLLATKIPRGLRFNDRMSMGRSKELRVPFLDHRVVEFGFGVPTSRLLAGGTTKALFRKIASRWTPADVANASKRSVQSPQREWLAQSWSELVLGLIRSTSFRDRGWIDPDRALEAYERYRGGNRKNSFPIWQWVNLELWARAFLDGAAPQSAIERSAA